MTLHAKAHDGQRRGVLIAELIWPNDAFEDGQGINTLTGADQPAPSGGGALPRQPGLDPPGLSRQDERQMNGRVRNRSALRD